MGKPHAWTTWSLISRQRCRYCGLLWLRNQRCDQAARQSCRWWDGDD